MIFTRTARRFGSALRPIVIAQIAMIVVVLTNGVSLVSLQPIVDRIFVSPIDPLSFEIPFIGRTLFISKFKLLAGLTGFFFISRILYSAGLYVQRYNMMAAGEIMVNGIRRDLYARLLSLSSAFYSRSRSGELVANLTSDLGVAQHLASTVTADLIRRPVEIAFLVALLCWLNAPLALASLVIAPLIAALINGLGRSVRSRSSKMQTTMADLSGLMQESVSGIRVIQSFAAEPRMAERFREAADKYLRRATRAYAMVSAATPATELVTACAITGIILYGGRIVILGKMTPGEFFTFMAILMSTYQPVKTLVNAISEANRAAAALERVYAVLDSPAEVASGTTPAPRAFQRLAYDKVSFAFPDAPNQTVLSEIEFSVERGQTIALVGPTSAGKTTLLSLLQRFNDPTAGRVTLDGRDIREFDLASLRRMIGVVAQETFLFNDTIAANIAFGKPGATNDEIAAAATAAQIRDTIEAMPQGFQTVVGERGQRLSGGEKQRLAIARALLVDPPILILDEATSSLDSDSETRVQAAIERLVAGRTTLVIAHRLSTVQHADRILVLESGRIVESGRHAELLAAQGLYARLHALQFRT